MTYYDRIQSRTRRGKPTLGQRLTEWWRIRRDEARMADLTDEARRDMGIPTDPDVEFLRRLKTRWTPRDPSLW